MSIAKILLIAAIVAILVVVLIIYSLSPTVKTFSNHPTFKSLVGKELEVKGKAYLLLVEEGQYVFTPYVLTTDSDYPGENAAQLSSGDKIIIEDFKTHRNNLGAGITRLYALGQFVHDGKTIEFEYALTTVNDEEGAVTSIPRTIWQNDDDEKMVFTNSK